MTSGEANSGIRMEHPVSIAVGTQNEMQLSEVGILLLHFSGAQ